MNRVKEGEVRGDWWEFKGCFWNVGGGEMLFDVSN